MGFFRGVFWGFLGGFFLGGFFWVGFLLPTLPCMKEDVLSDLPPKITQDYVCDLSPLQIQLYEDFARSRVSKKVFWAFLIIGYLQSIMLAVKYVERVPVLGICDIFVRIRIRVPFTNGSRSDSFLQ